MKQIAKTKNVNRSLLPGLAMVLLGLSACEDLNVMVLNEQQEAAISRTEQATEVKKYVIRTGEQHATLTFEQTALSKLRFRALFDTSSIYQTVDPENQGDINKLYGVSDCSSYHHNNSARFGWRWYQDQLEIWAYSYVEGKRKATFIDTVSFDTYNDYEILFTTDKYIFKLNDKEVEIPRACQATATGYKLFPYFGGQETAPKDISIWIEELND